MSLSIPDWLKSRLRRPVAVLGGGVSGSSAATLAQRLGGSAVVYDQASSVPEEMVFDSSVARQHDLVVVSPGFDAAHAWIQAARQAGCEVLPELELGALAWPGRIIAVTGTNGKTTITEFLVAALRLAGHDAHPAGNIGLPLSELAASGETDESSVAVCEVSSFQSELLRFFEADTTLWSNVAEDHLDRHGTLEAYFRAKYNLVKRTRQRRVIYGPTVADCAREFGCSLPVAGAVSFAGASLPSEVANTVFGRPPQSDNFHLVAAFGTLWKLPENVLVDAARTFRLALHRLAKTGEVRGVSFWNDSKATNFHAVEAALAGFAEPVLWIGGGRAKGGDIEGFARRLAPRVRRAFLLGETAKSLHQALSSAGIDASCCDSLRDAVIRALEAAPPGAHVVFSPGFASFDMFKNYADRGRQFEATVDELSARPAPSLSSIHKSSFNRSVYAGLCLL